VAVLKPRRLAVALVLAATAAVRAQSDAPPPTEYEVKAAFLYNFARFVEWPAEAFRDAHAPFVIAVLGRDPFGRALDQTVAGKSVLGRRIEVRRADRLDGVRGAHIVFVSASERGHLSTILRAMNAPGVLVVGETDGFAQRGGAINFVLHGNKVRFEINPARAEQSRLRISSQLLKLATLVAGERD
jgi:hypothetical protein